MQQSTAAAAIVSLNQNTHNLPHLHGYPLKNPGVEAPPKPLAQGEAGSGRRAGRNAWMRVSGTPLGHKHPSSQRHTRESRRGASARRGWGATDANNHVKSDPKKNKNKNTSEHHSRSQITDHRKEKEN